MGWCLSTRCGALLGLAVLFGCSAGTVGGGSDAGAGDGGLAFSDGSTYVGRRCNDNGDCPGKGLCVGGHCCPSADQACGTHCCATSARCFANACVTPGKLCYSAADCAKGEYCEPSLGPGGADAGAAADAGATCLQPAPAAGRCLTLPKRCAGADGGAAASADGGSSCLPPCEFRPKAGKLNAVAEWSWGAKTVKTYKTHVDVWSTPVIGRVTDTNCDGKVNELDPPNIIVVTGDAKGTCCSCSGASAACKTGVLRALDGATGKELWSLRRASSASKGFAANSLALGDIDGDGSVEVFAFTGEGKLVMVDAKGKVQRTSDKPVPGYTSGGFGWGGGLAIADMDGDGAPEVAFGATVFSTKGGKLTRLFVGKGGIGGGGANRALSVLSDVDGDGKQELIAGNAAYRSDGTPLWQRTGLGDGYPAVGDFDRDGKPEIAMVYQGQLWILAGATGKTLAGPTALPGTGKGGPPTIADFDGDGRPEVGVAKATYYSVTRVDLKNKKLSLVWRQVNHDFSSSVTGSTVFDFEGDGKAEVIYNDECFLWVYDGKTGAVRFATPTTSFTGTEASLVADVDGDGRAEIVMISNGASPTRWKCNVAPWTQPDAKLGRPAWKPPAGAKAYRGLTVWGDRARSWVGTRTLWNQHSYHVSNICDDRDSACSANNRYGAIPAKEQPNWKVSWLNNFRQNVQDKGIFDAPDATVTLRAECTSPIQLRATLRNLGLALLPKGVIVGFYVRSGGSDRELARRITTSPLFPGQATVLRYAAQPSDKVGRTDAFVAKIVNPATNRTFNECRADNNSSKPTKVLCIE